MLFGVGAIVLLLWSLIGALVIQLATKMVAGFKPGYGIAFLTALVAVIAGACVNYGLGMALSTMAFAWAICLVVAIAVEAAIIGFMIKNPQGTALGFAKGLLVTVIEIVIMTVLFVGVPLLLLSLLGGGAH